MKNINYKKLISRSDIIYNEPVEDSKEGLPIGNGRMGTLVWTSPSKVKYQINRADLIPVNCNHKGKQYGITDFCCGCAQVDLFVGDAVYRNNTEFEQRLQLYNGTVYLRTPGLTVESFVDANSDVMIIHVTDNTGVKNQKYLTLKMLRPQIMQQDEFSAENYFVTDNNNVLAVQKFNDGNYATESAVCVTSSTIVGLNKLDNSTYQIDLDKNATEHVIYVSSADSYKKSEEPISFAIELAQNATKSGYSKIKSETDIWWDSFWPKSFVYASSKDKVAQFLERTRSYYIYLMAISSQGLLPPKFNGALWTTEGDKRMWGSQYWVWNMELLYFGMLAANHLELADCYFNMMYDRLPNCEKAAEWWWGSKGIYMPETTPFDGPLPLEGEIAKELQDITLRRKDAELASEDLRRATRFESVQKTYFDFGNINGYFYVSHILSSSSSIAMQFWWYYKMTGDKVFLKNKVYPFVKGSIEFYRNYSKLGDDGIYHIYPSNIQESYWGAKDGIIDISAMKGLIPLGLNIAQELNIDLELMPLWKNFFEKLPTYPMGNEPAAVELQSSLGEDLWAGGRMGDVCGNHNSVQLWLMPVFPFENVTLSTNDTKMLELARKTYYKLPHRQHLLENRHIPVWSRISIILARLGLKEEFKWVTASHFATSYAMRNGLDISEGDQAQNTELHAASTMAMQEALVQSVPTEPGKEEHIHLYAAWPDDWDTAFKLLVRGGFIITSQKSNGVIKFVHLISNLGETLRIVNPWKDKTVYIYINGELNMSSSNNLIVLNTSQGDEIVLLDEKVSDVNDAITFNEFDYSQIEETVNVTMPNGNKASKRIGRKAQAN